MGHYASLPVLARNRYLCLMILIGLGSNLPSPHGPSPQTITAAVRALSRHGLAVQRVSSLWHTPPYPKSAQPWFSNAVAAIATPLGPQEVLHRLHEVERRFSRKRRIKWAPRPLDLDLLDYHGMILGAEQEGEDHLTRPLILPHPAVGSRNFVLYPLQEVAPRWTHPVSGEGVASLIARLPRGDLIRKGQRIQPI